MFKKMLFVFSVLFVIGAIGYVFAQSDEEIITQFIKKQKEIADRSKINSLYQEFKVTMMGMDVPYKIWIKGDNMRYETTFMGQSTIVVLTPNSGWQIQNGTVTDIPTEQITIVKKQIMNQTLAGNINFADDDLTRDKNHYEILGREKIDGINCYRMKIMPKDTSEKSEGIFWFEPNTYLLRKISLKENQMGQEQNVEILVKDYQQVGGTTFPKLVEMKFGDDQNLKIEYTTVKVNEPVDDSLFKK